MCKLILLLLLPSCCFARTGPHNRITYRSNAVSLPRLLLSVPFDKYSPISAMPYSIFTVFRKRILWFGVISFDVLGWSLKFLQQKFQRLTGLPRILNNCSEVINILWSFQWNQVLWKRHWTMEQSSNFKLYSPTINNGKCSCQFPKSIQVQLSDCMFEMCSFESA